MEIAKYDKPGKPFMAGIALLLAALIAACGNTSDSSSSPPSSTSAAASSSSPSVATTAATEGKAYRVGETASLFDLKLTVDRVETAAAYNEQVLQEGTEFVLVRVTLENAGSDTKKYNSSSFELLPSSGKPDLSVTTLNNETELHLGDLAPGGKVSGVLPFEHPKGDPVMKLTYKPNLMSDEKIVFDLK